MKKMTNKNHQQTLTSIKCELEKNLSEVNVSTSIKTYVYLNNQLRAIIITPLASSLFTTPYPISSSRTGNYKHHV